jgi:hypothetical protein
MKNLPGKNTPAYFAATSVTKKESFKTLTPVDNAIKLSTAKSYAFS